MAKRKAEPTREEAIQTRIEDLQSIRGRSRQAQAELDWLWELQKRDVIQAEMDAGAAELAGLQEQRTEVKHRLAALEADRRAVVQEASLSDLLEAVKAKQANYNECAALAEVVQELTRRIVQARSEQRARTKEYNQLTSRCMSLKNRAGIPG